MINLINCLYIKTFVFFLPTKIAMKIKITDDQYFDRLIPSMMLPVKILPINCVSYTDGINPLIKLFNGIVSYLII
jgi:hypothetical protein